MFEFLKKKIAAFTEKVKGKIEKKPEAAQEAREKAPEKELIIGEEEQPAIKETAAEKAALERKAEPEGKPEAAGGVVGAPEEPSSGAKVKASGESGTDRGVSAGTGRPGGETRELKAKVSIRTRLAGLVRGRIRLEEKDLREFLEEFELALLESDVEHDTAKEIVAETGRELAGKEIPRGEDVSAFLKRELRVVLQRIMQTAQIDLLSEMKGKKPFIILFLGPNGAGKTTSMAKLTHMLQGKGRSVIWAAADTFRAASIEQLEKHASALNVRVVRHQYGSDPAAVAFDAIRAAEAGRADVVMIDSAGRQETNRNLMEELKKIVRVAKPDLKIYVGEAFTGQALLQQAGEFDGNLGIDGFILTKIDCDAKGGTAISLLYKLKKPILFVGVGQGYGDLEEFEPEFILRRVLG